MEIRRKIQLIEIIKELKIEVSKPNIFQAVVAKQYDMNTRFIKATLVDGSDVIYIPAEATVKVVINAERPDGQSKGFDGAVNDDGTVTVPLHSWMLEMEGTVLCDISIIDTDADDNKKLTTTAFTLLVEKAAYGGDDVTNDPQYDVLVSLMETCVNAEKIAQEALKKSTECASAIHKTISGGDKSLTITDVSPLAHKCSCRLTSDTIKTNLFEYEENNIRIVSLTTETEINQAYRGMLVDNADGSFVLNGGVAPYDGLRLSIYFRNLESDKEYTVSIRNSANEVLSFQFLGFGADGNPTVGWDDVYHANKYTFVKDENTSYYCLDLMLGDTNDGNPFIFDNLTYYIQLEYGPIMTDWESIEGKPCIEDFSSVIVYAGDNTYRPTEDGMVTDIVSKSPNMTITTNNNNVNITDFFYYVDTKAYVDSNSGGGSGGGADVDLTDYVKNTDYATPSGKAGIVSASSKYGIAASSGGVLTINQANQSDIDKKIDYKPIVPANLDYAVKVGLTTNTETLTEEEKVNAQSWLGLGTYELVEEITVTEAGNVDKSTTPDGKHYENLYKNMLVTIYNENDKGSVFCYIYRGSALCMITSTFNASEFGTVKTEMIAPNLAEWEVTKRASTGYGSAVSKGCVETSNNVSRVLVNGCTAGTVVKIYGVRA